MVHKEKDRYRQIIGAWGENLAAEYLMERGLRIVARNYRTHEGEIDIIAQEEDTLVFVEVKTRTNREFGFPEENVTEEKLEHLHNAAEQYLSENIEVGKWRYDVIAIIGKPEKNDTQIEWFQDAG